MGGGFGAQPDCAAPTSFLEIHCPPAKQFLWCCRAPVQSGWMNLKHLLRQRGFPSEGFPAREYFHVSSLISKWIEIVSKATQMHNGLKSVLKAQFNNFKIVTRLALKNVICCQWKPAPAQSTESTHPTIAKLPKLAQVFSEPTEVPCYTNW